MTPTRTGQLQQRTTLVVTSIVAAMLVAGGAATVVGVQPFATAQAQAQSQEPTISVSDATVVPGETTTVEVVLSNAPNGLSGYGLTVRVANPEVATIVGASSPDVFGVSETIFGADNASVRIRAADLERTIQHGATGVTLATITLEGVTVGETQLVIENLNVDDEDGDPVAPATEPGTVTVRAATALTETRTTTLSPMPTTTSVKTPASTTSTDRRTPTETAMIKSTPTETPTEIPTTTATATETPTPTVTSPPTETASQTSTPTETSTSASTGTPSPTTTPTGTTMPTGGESPTETTAPTASVVFNNQSVSGTTVVVESVTMSEGGFVAIHNASLLEGNALGSVVGVSEYLSAGTHENVEITLFDVPGQNFAEDMMLEGSQTLIAMPHLDTNENEVYDFITSNATEDDPYVANGSAVVDSAFITVEKEMDEEDDGGATPVCEAGTNDEILGENDADDDGDGAIDEDDEDNDGPSNDDDDGDSAVDEDDECDDGDDGSDEFNGEAEDDDDGDGAFDEDDEPDSGNSDDVDNDGDGAVDEDDEPDTDD
jgi:hypothetical protein